MPLPWNNNEDENNMLRLLEDGTIAALVIDVPFTDYQTSMHCNLFEVGGFGCVLCGREN